MASFFILASRGATPFDVLASRRVTLFGVLYYRSENLRSSKPSGTRSRGLVHSGLWVNIAVVSPWTGGAVTPRNDGVIKKLNRSSWLPQLAHVDVVLWPS